MKLHQIFNETCVHIAFITRSKNVIKLIYLKRKNLQISKGLKALPVVLGSICTKSARKKNYRKIIKQTHKQIKFRFQRPAYKQN